MPAPGKLWVGSVVIDCTDFDAMLRFWRQALGYEVRAPTSEDWGLLFDPLGAGPNLAFQRESEARDPRYRFHLDLYSNDPTSEVRRLVGLGAKLVRPQRDGEDFTTLTDPDGNPFDVVDVASRGFGFGQRVDRPRGTGTAGGLPPG